MVNKDVWLDRLNKRLAFLETKKDDPDPRFRRMAAVQIPTYQKYRKELERTGHIDSAMYEMVMGNM